MFFLFDDIISSHEPFHISIRSEKSIKCPNAKIVSFENKMSQFLLGKCLQDFVVYVMQAGTDFT